MNILYISHGLYPCEIGGFEIFNYFLIQEIAKKHCVAVITCCDKEISSDLTTISINPKLLGSTKISAPLLDLINIYKLRNSIDLIHISYMDARLLEWVPIHFAKKMFGIPYIISIHGGGMYRWKIKILHKYLFKYAEFIVGVSQEIKNEYEKRSRRKILLIPPLVPFKKSNTEKKILRDKYKIKRSEIILLSLGSIKTYKGSDILLKGFLALGLNFMEKYKLRLIFVGDGEMRVELETFVEQKGFKKYVKFFGSISYEEVRDFYRISDIYIIPSLFEGTPISLLEAMYNGMPIIGSDSTGINNIIKDGKNGLLFKSGDSEDLKKQIVYMIKNTDVSNNLGLNAKIDFNKNYRFDTTVREYLDIYDAIERRRKN